MPARAIEEIEARLVACVAGILDRPAESIDAAAPLHTLGIDSLNLIALLVAIERDFGVNLMESELSRVDFETLQRLARSVHAELGE